MLTIKSLGMCVVALALVVSSTRADVAVFDSFPIDDLHVTTTASYGPGSNHNMIAQGFVWRSAVTKLGSVTIDMYHDSGTNGALDVSLYDDNNGKPGNLVHQIDDGTTYPDYPGEWPPNSNPQPTTFDVDEAYAMTPGDTYWVVAAPDASSSSTYKWYNSLNVEGGSMERGYIASLGGWGGWRSYPEALALRAVDSGTAPNKAYFDSEITTGTAGGIGFDFSSVDSSGVLTANETSVRDLSPEQQDAMNFTVSTSPAQCWSIGFDGTFSGTADLTFTYNDGSLLIPESDLSVYHHNDVTGRWEALPVVGRDLVNNTITVRTDSFSPFAMGGPIPEPASMALLSVGGLMFLRRRR